MATKLGTGSSSSIRSHTPDPIERRKNIWVVVARHLANKAVGYSTKALEAHHHRPDPYEQEDILTRKMARDEERARRQEERRLHAESEAESPGAPWIYMPGLLKEGPAERAERKLEAAKHTHHVRRMVSARTGGTPSWIIWVQVLLILSLLSIPALAVEPSEMLKDPAMEARARTISAGLRCLVCQNETIDESHADLAADLRRLVRERLQAGDTDQQVTSYITQRYGDYVLLRPPFQTNTYVLWLAPALVLVLGGVGLVFYYRGRRRRAVPEEAPLTAAEARVLAKVMGQR